MPTPRQFARQRELLGYGPARVYSYLEPEAPLESFAPEVQDDLIVEEGIRRERSDLLNQWKADDAVSGILDTAGQQNSPALMQMLLDNPQVLRSREFPMLENYVQMRQQMEKPSPYSDMVLGPQFSNRIQNPMLRRQFEDEMTSGANFETAKRNHLNREHNYTQELALAKAGIAPERFTEFQGPDGLYDERKVMSALAPKPVSPLDNEIKFIESRLSNLARQAEAQGKMVDELPEYQAMADDLTGLYRQRRQQGGTGAPAAAVAEPVLADVAAVVDTAPVAPPPPTALPKAPHLRAAEEQQAVEQNRTKRVIDSAWQNAKVDLADKLAKKFDIEDVLGHLGAIVSGDRAPAAKDDPVDEFGRTQAEDYASYLLRQLDLPPDDVAFEEPENVRGGSNKVRYSELLKALARDVLQQLGYDVDGALAKKPGQPTPALPQIKSEVAKSIASDIDSGKY